MASSTGGQLMELSKLYRVMRTVGEMAQDRGYQIPHELIPESLEEFRARYTVDGSLTDIRRDAMTIPCERIGGGRSGRMMIFFVPPHTMSMENMKAYYTQAQESHAQRMVLITSGKVNATVKKHIEDTNRMLSDGVGVKVQLFDEEDLVVNITRHELVPKHVPMEEEEVRAMLQAHSLERSALPRMLSTDPVALYFGLDRGRVVKIERKSVSAGQYVTYRQVV